MPFISELRSLASLEPRDSLSCPESNGTVYSADGYSWNILCGWDYPDNDLPAAPSTSLAECITACNTYQRDLDKLAGASCVAVVFNPTNVNGDKCYLKGKIDKAFSNATRLYTARRTQYNIGDAAIYTSIAPSATSNPTSQATSSSAATSTATTPSSSSSSSSPSTGLSDSAKVGIGVGAGVAGAIILALLLYIFCSRRRRQKNAHTPAQVATKSSPAELGQTASASANRDKPEVLSHPFPLSAGAHHPSENEKATTLGRQELSSPHPLASELSSPTTTYHELAAAGTPVVGATGADSRSPASAITPPSSNPNAHSDGTGSWKWSPLLSSASERASERGHSRDPGELPGTPAESELAVGHSPIVDSRTRE